MKQTRYLALVSLLIVISATAEADDAPLRVGLFQSSIETTSLDNVSSYQQIVFLKQIGQTLIETGPLGEVMPGLATAWTLSADRRTYAFHLRNAFFHDGTPLTSVDVVYSLKRSIDARGNVASYYLTVVESITARGTNEIEIKLTRPFSPLLSVLSSGALVITKKRPETATPVPFIGTGPYKIDSRDGVRVRLSAFAQYSGSYPPKLPKVELISDAELARVKRQPAADELPDYEVLAVGPRLNLYPTPKFERVSSPAMVSGGLFINPRIKKYQDRQARLALFALFQAVMDQPLFDHPGQVLSDIFPKGMIAHRENRPSLLALRAELAKAKLPPKNSKICVNFHTMLGAESKFHTAIAAKSGHDVDFVILPFADAMKEWKSYKCDAFFMTWQSVFLDPEAGLVAFRILEPFASPRSMTKFRKLSEAASAEAMPPVRAKLYDEIADLVLKEAVYLPVYQPDHVEFLNRAFGRADSVYRYQQMISEIYRVKP